MNKEKEYKNFEANRQVYRKVEVARKVIDLDGMVIFEKLNERKTTYMEKKGKTKIEVSFNDFGEEIARIKYDISEIANFVVNAYQKGYDIFFEIGGIDFTENPNLISEFMDYSIGFQFMVVDEFDRPIYVLARSFKNPLDIELFDFKELSECWPYPKYEVRPYSATDDLLKKGYKIFGYGGYVLVD